MVSQEHMSSFHFLLYFCAFLFFFLFSSTIFFLFAFFFLIAQINRRVRCQYFCMTSENEKKYWEDFWRECKSEFIVAQKSLCICARYIFPSNFYRHIYVKYKRDMKENKKNEKRNCGFIGICRWKNNSVMGNWKLHLMLIKKKTNI